MSWQIQLLDFLPIIAISYSPQYVFILTKAMLSSHTVGKKKKTTQHQGLLNGIQFKCSFTKNYNITMSSP